MDKPCSSATPEPLDRGDAVNLAHNIRGTDNIEDITRKGILTLVDGVLRMDAELTRLYRAQSATQPINQCDGCRRGLPLRANNIHYDGEFPSAVPVMGCTADRYTASASGANVEAVGFFVQRDGRWVEVEDRVAVDDPTGIILYREAKIHSSDRGNPNG